jgi:plasmid stabilization system protein ParE
MIEVQLAESAQPDIHRIWDFYARIEADLPSRAIAALFSGLDILQAHPEVGEQIEAGLRQLRIKFGGSGFVALYRYNPVAEAVWILRIRHQREAGFQER